MSYPETGGKSPAKYAVMLMELYYHNKEDAEKEVFNAARTIMNVPCSYWREVFLIIHNM